MAMRTSWSFLLGGVAAAAVGLAGAAALAQSSNTHVMTVALPGGGTAQITYTGNIAPQVSIGDTPASFAPMPMAPFFGPNSPFAQLDRISAEMDRQAAAMFRQAETMAAEARSGQLTETALRNLPPGSQGYTFVSTMSGNNVCSQSVQITTPSNGGPPHVVTHSSGNCAAMPEGGATGAVSLPNAAPPASRPDAVWTAAHGAQPYRGLVEPIPTTAR
jgi:hypothetical protein